ncbi:MULTISPECIES: alpha/beta hydrolase [unclassified Microcoleus]|uniref:alpha/beta fold hydrolase n=1 Tax=unclassified Microcoleus TaxID=2642155 RepID=UPI00312B309D
MYSQLRNSRIKLSLGQIFWHEVGQGPNLVFLHGSWDNSNQWLKTIEYLCPQYHCFAPDLLGFGDSERPKMNYSIDLEVECLAQYLDTLNLQEVYLIGHSLGGWVATSYALKYPDRVKGLVLLAPEGVNAGTRRGRWQMARLLTGTPPVAYWLLRSLYPIAKLFGGQNKIEELLKFRKQLIGSPVAMKLLFRRRGAEIKAELVDEKLCELTAPLLLLQESQNPAPASSSLCQSYAALATRAEIEFINSESINLLVEYPDLVAKYIREFAKQ